MTAWNQSCTYGIFTLLPILLFVLVSLWQMKMSHDTEMKQIQWELDKATKELEKSVELSKAAEEELHQEKDTMKQISEERSRLQNKTNILKDEIKIVEDKVLNLTSKLLLKEVEAGIEKEENKRLLDTIENMKKNALNEQTKSDLLKLNDINSNLKEDGLKIEEKKTDPLTILKQALDITPEKDLEVINSTTEKSAKVAEKKADARQDQIVDKMLEMKKKALNEREKAEMHSKIKEVENKSIPIRLLEKALEMTTETGLDIIKSTTEKIEKMSVKNEDEQKDAIVDKILEIKKNALDERKMSDIQALDNEAKKIIQEAPKTEELLDDKSQQIKMLKKALEKTLLKQALQKPAMNASKEKSREQLDDKANDKKDGIVDKVLEIKHIQQELDDAKQELLSNINKTETKLDTKEIEKGKISIDLEIRDNLSEKNEENKKIPSEISKMTTEQPTSSKSHSKDENSEALAEKIIEIKQKEQELNDAKKELFSNKDDVSDKNDNKKAEVGPKEGNIKEKKSSKEKSSLVNNQNEKSLNNNEDIADKVNEIKQKEQELNDAKKELFSSSDNVVSSDKQEGQKIELDINAGENKANNNANIKAMEADSKSDDEKKIHIILDLKDKADKKDTESNNKEKKVKK